MYLPCCYSGGLALRDAEVKNKQMLMLYCTREDRENRLLEFLELHSMEDRVQKIDGETRRRINHKGLEDKDRKA